MSHDDRNSWICINRAGTAYKNLVYEIHSCAICTVHGVEIDGL